MTNIQAIKQEYAQTSTGSIDYQYYDQRARNIRSECVLKLFKKLFTGKKNSSTDEPESGDVMNTNPTDEQKEQFDSLKKAA